MGQHHPSCKNAQLSQLQCCGLGAATPSEAAQARTSATHGFDLDENWTGSSAKPAEAGVKGEGVSNARRNTFVSADPMATETSSAPAGAADQPPETTPEAPPFPELSEADGVSPAEFSSASGSYKGQINKGGDAHGHGVFTASTFQYEGQWRSGKHNGEGKQTWSDGRTFSGQFVDSQFWGRGRMTWTSDSGDIAYEGQYQADKKHGQGRMIWPSGKVYDGQWFEGQRHGRATTTSKDGLQVEESWSYNLRVDSGCKDKATTAIREATPRLA